MLINYLGSIFLVMIAAIGFITVYTQIDYSTKQKARTNHTLSQARLDLPQTIFVCLVLLLLRYLDSGAQVYLHWVLINIRVIILVYANLLAPSLVDFIIVQILGVSLFYQTIMHHWWFAPLYIISCLIVYGARWYGPKLAKFGSAVIVVPPIIIGELFWLVTTLFVNAPVAIGITHAIAFFWAYLALRNFDQYQRKDQQVIARLTQEVQYDALTQVRNWQTFQNDFNARYAERKRGNQLALVAMDLDHFKQINDTRGHLMGNQALMMVGTQIKAHIHGYSEDYRFYRTGGEEFAMILPHTDLARATEIVTECEDMIRQMPVRFGGVEISITASFGLTMVRDSDSNPTTVFKRADHYLYMSKRGGRNQITVEGEKLAR